MDNPETQKTKMMSSKNKNKEQKTKQNKTKQNNYKQAGIERRCSKGKQFLLLIKHPSCYSYI